MKRGSTMLFGCCIAAALSVTTGSSGAADSYPMKPVRIVVPFAAEGPNDFIARVIGQKLTETWGHPVIVDNRAGAGGNIGTQIAAKAPPDGYTIALVSTAFVVNPSKSRSTMPHRGPARPGTWAASFSTRWRGRACSMCLTTAPAPP